MIAKLKGLVDTVGEDFAIIDVNGVGYLLFCSARTLRSLGSAGAEVTVHVETHVREDHIHLYGFASVAEREWFRLLQTVQGVGAKLALVIQSTLTSDQLRDGVAMADLAMLSQPSGVGKKLAQRLATELKDKVAAMPGATILSGAAGHAAAAPVDGGGLGTIEADAISALENLGYRRADAGAAVLRARANLGDKATLDNLIPAALQELSG